MKQLTVLLPALFICTLLSAQNPAFLLHEGVMVTMEIKSWPNILNADAKFLKAKPDAKNELVAARNADILAGKLQPSKYPMVYTLSKVSSDAGTAFYKSATQINGKEFASYLKITKDTLYLYRNKDVIPMELNGENLGYTIQGVEKIPFALKVGDVLPIYEDFGVVYPKTVTSQVQEWFKANEGKEFVVYELRDVTVRKTMSINAHTLNNVNARVTRNEPIEVGGKTYTAFVIESETWTKAQTSTTIDASEKESQDAHRAWQKKMEEKAGKALVKAGMLNEQGYNVIAKEEWFVPELGIVKQRVYDMSGAITADVDVKVSL